MVTRVKAIRAVFGMFLTMVELIISLNFFFKLLCSDEVLGQISQSFSNFSSSNPLFPDNYVDGRRVAGLVVVLVFMLFGYVLIFFVPKEVARRERKNELYGDVFAD